MRFAMPMDVGPLSDATRVTCAVAAALAADGVAAAELVAFEFVDEDEPQPARPAMRPSAATSAMSACAMRFTIGTSLPYRRT
jgi:hypothetical protein